MTTACKEAECSQVEVGVWGLLLSNPREQPIIPISSVSIAASCVLHRHSNDGTSWAAYLCPPRASNSLPLASHRASLYLQAWQEKSCPSHSLISIQAMAGRWNSFCFALLILRATTS